MKNKTFKIKDWAGNIKFDGQEFKSFEDAEYFLELYFDGHGLDYEIERCEYEIFEAGVTSEN